MGKEFLDDEIKDLAGRIYDLDQDISETLGSSLGRVFSRDRKVGVLNIMQMLHSKASSSKMRSELAAVGNMGRTIEDKEKRSEIMRRYKALLTEVQSLPSSMVDDDVLDPRITDLATSNLKDRFKNGEHMIICISRSYTSGGNEIAFAVSDALRCNFYDVNTINEEFKRMYGDDAVQAIYNFKESKIPGPIKYIREFGRHHGLSKDDVIFFDTTKLLLEKAKEEDFVVQGRFADAILTNNHIPHISIFVTAPLKRRVTRLMGQNDGMTAKQARRFIKIEDKRHEKMYRYYTGRSWGKASNYDISINTSTFGIRGSIEAILKMIGREDAIENMRPIQ